MSLEPGILLGPNVVHEHLVRGQCVLDRRPCIIGLFQPDSTAKFVENLDPEAGLELGLYNERGELIILCVL